MSTQLEPKAPAALTKTGPINASHLLCMVLEKNSISLPGFDSPKTKMFAPGVHFVSLAKTGRNELGAEVAWQGSRTRKILLACAAMLSLSLLLAAMLFRLAGSYTEAVESPRGPMAWSAQKVESTGLRIRSGSNDLLIPVGSRLPNGEILMGVSTDRMTYTTPSGVTTVSTQIK